MKILHVISDSNIGGAGVLLLNTLRHRDKDKFDVSVVMPKGAELEERVKELGCKVITTEYGRDKSFDRNAVKELKKIIKEEKPDILHTHASLSARIAGRKCRAPLIFMTHHCAVVPPKYKTVFPMKNLLGMINNHYSDRIVATAEVAKNILVSMGTDPEKITVIINGSEPMREVSIAEKESVRKELGLTEENFIFSMIARLEPVKDHRTFILAAAEASRTHPEMRFLIVGDGSLAQSLRALADDLGMSNKIIFAGFRQNVAPFLAISDVNVNCSFSETSCLAVSEGMSAGKSSVVSDCDGNIAMINDGENGLVFERENSEMLATAMITLCENRELCARMGASAKTAFENKYTAEKMTKTLESLYEKEFNKKEKTNVRGKS